jgi:hypothetical protein
MRSDYGEKLEKKASFFQLKSTQKSYIKCDQLSKPVFTIDTQITFKLHTKTIDKYQVSFDSLITLYKVRSKITLTTRYFTNQFNYLDTTINPNYYYQGTNFKITLRMT